MVNKSLNESNLDAIVSRSRQAAEQRGHGYREQALKMYPWVCGRCTRSFTRANLSELTVHHRNHDHDYNPPDGSNWELLCVYCHDNEHSRLLDHAHGSLTGGDASTVPAAPSPFAALAGLLKKSE